MDNENQIQESESQTEILPEDLMVEHIMPRLPAKPLMRFKCVSKSWQSTISNPQFAKSHFKLHSPPSPPFLLFSSNSQHPPFTVVTFDENGRINELAPLDFTLNTGVPFHVAGTSIGLVCLFDKYFNFRICNPVTRQCNDIPPISSPEFDPITVIAVGFGHVSSVDDYKIGCLHGLSDNYLAEDIDVFGVYIFSLKTQKWQELSCFGTQVDGISIARADVPVIIDDIMYCYSAAAHVVLGVNLVSGEFSMISFSLFELIDSLRRLERIKLFRSNNGRLSLFCAKQAWVLNEDAMG